MARRGCRRDSGCSASRRPIAAAGWRGMGDRGTQPRRAAGRRRVTVGASLPMPGLTAWQGLFGHGRLQAGQGVLVHGAAGAAGSMVTGSQASSARTSSAPAAPPAVRRGSTSARWSSSTLKNDALEDAGGVDPVFDVIGGDIQRRSAGVIRAGGTLVTIAARPGRGPWTAWPSALLSCPIAPDWVRSSGGCGTDGCGRTSATSRPSTMPSRPSIRPSGSAGRRSSAFVRERHAPSMGEVDRGGAGGCQQQRRYGHGHRRCREGAPHQPTVQHAAIAPAAAGGRSAACWRSLMPGPVPSAGGLWR